MFWTLSSYTARRFLTIAISTFLAVFSLILIVDMVELLRANKAGRASFPDLIGMALLHAPSVTITAAPFTVLLASMTCFALMARTSELVVTRAAGVSVWRLLLPAVLAGAALGVFAFAAYNPVASAFASKFEQLEERYFDRSASRLSVSAGGLWLRQGDETGQTVIRAKRASGTVERLWGVTIFQFDPADRLYRRMTARAAVLEDGAWRLHGVLSWDLSGNATGQDDTTASTIEEMWIVTDLTVDHIQDSFAAPQTISFWDLPGFIGVLEESGFSTARHRMHWHSLLASPVVFVAMVLIGAAFSMRHARFGGLGTMALGCVLSGFGYFFLSDIANALGASGAIPVELAAWGPPTSAMCFAVALLLHLEDG